MNEVLRRARRAGGCTILLLCLSALPVGTQSLAHEAPVYDLAAPGSLDARVTQLERKLDARNQPQVHQMLAELQRELELLRGVFERNQYEWQKVASKQEKLEELLRARGISVENDSRNDTKDAASQVALLPKASEGSVLRDGKPQSEQDAYKGAVQMVLEQKRYDQAVELFKHFISVFPKSGYVPNAHYWLGQIYLKLGDKVKSENNFTVVVNSFPQSAKSSSAMLQLAYLLQARGDQKGAKEMFQRIIQSYASSSEAEIAKAQMKVFQN